MTKVNQKPIKFGESMIETLYQFSKTEGFRSSILNICESGLDVFLEQDEIVKQIPILGSIYSISKAGIAVKDYLFIKKLLRFMNGLQDNFDEIKLELEKAEVDQEFLHKLGEQLFMAIERFEQINKVDALCKLFIAYCKNKISYQEFLNFLYVLDKINIYSINSLQEFYTSNSSKGSQYDMSSFLLTGLVSIYFGNTLEQKAWVSSNLSGIGFMRNQSGEKFLKILELLD